MIITAAKQYKSPVGTFIHTKPAKRFFKFYPQYENCEITEEFKFADTQVQAMFEAFVHGHSSNIRTSKAPVYIIARVNDDGTLTTSTSPVANTSFQIALREKQRLEDKFKANFLIFTSMPYYDKTLSKDQVQKDKELVNKVYQGRIKQVTETMQVKKAAKESKNE